ncbi:MAG: hypothetical protein WC889_20575, partial [Myxococcota bacterium]
MKYFVTTAVAAAVLAASLTAFCDDSAIRLKHGVYAYEHGDYAEAVETLGSVLNPVKLTSEDDIITARKYLGASYYFAQKKNEAAEEFKKLLLLRPDYNLDAFLFPPPMVLFFDEIRMGMKDLVQKAKPTVEKPQTVEVVRETVRIVEKRVEKHMF